MILQPKTALQSRSHLRLVMFIAIAAVAIVLGLTASKASAANMLDQGTGPNVPTSIGGSNNIGQSFTAGKTGTMYDLDLFLSQVSPPAGTTLTIEIHDGENPNGTLLGSRTLSYNEVLALSGWPGGKFTVTFRDGINVTAGNKYTIMIRSTPTTGQVTMHMYDTDVYSGGMSYYMGVWKSSYDLGFQTYVSDSYRSYIPSITVSPIVSTYGQATPFSATLMVDGEPLANKYVNFSVDGSTVGIILTNASGVASFSHPHLYSAGSHTVGVSFAAAYPYYAASATTTLTINKADLMVSANFPSKIYGDGLPTFTGMYTGAVAGDLPLITGAVQFSTGATSASDVGAYVITPSLNTVLSNYNVNFGYGALTVTPAPLSVTASNATRQYGEANPALAGTLTGLVNGDAITASYTTAAVANSTVGDYAITPQLADPSGKLSNYAVTTTPAILTVTKAPLTVQADNLSRWVNASNPTLTGTITGAWAADDLTANYTTSADPSSPIGTYPITPGLVDPLNRLSNYDVTTNPAVLTVYASPAPAFATGDSAASVTQDVQLPAVDEKGNALQWTSTDNSLLDPTTGEVHSPSFTAGDKQVMLEAAATVNHMNVSVSFVLTLKAAAMTDAEAVALDKGLLAIGYAPAENEANVKSQVSLPANGANGSVITWSSSNANYVNAQTGAVHQPTSAAGDQRVTLTATITKGAASITKTFQLNVLHDLSLIVQPDPVSDLYVDIVDGEGKTKRIVISQASAAAGAIRIDADQTDIQIELNAEVLDQLRKINSAFKLLVSTPAGSITIPAAAFEAKAIVRYIIHVGAAASPSMQAALTAQQANVGAGPVAFQLAMINNKGLKIDLPTFQEAAARTIIADAKASKENAVVVRWDETRKTFSYVPAQFTVADGKLVATFSSQETGVYLIVNRPVLFNDLAQHWAKEDAEWLASRFIIEGRSAGQFDPNSGLTRAETAALLVRALGISGDATGAAFSDISGKWYEQAVAAAAEAGLVTGYEDGTFRPNAKVTREELALMITRAIKYSGASVQPNGAAHGVLIDAGSVSAWATGAVQQVLDLGIVKGDPNGSFRPQATATRAEMTAMLRRLLEALQYA
ncbi:S-layer domain protein [Paenibacillus curdlanolyticus YK9]|uniref:S-layer domain protein n=1 Tax=Paenibacillus curdlanolyticus YK9 TaxID=717606 RepID=E0IA42_9BACL|nr:immunoglobulin-like domain-containing protein [Paenibacillus curdlanolyticus]EFM10619.1 S-layer domain protein [Paenibacillus curdlanolyticus YK9]